MTYVSRFGDREGYAFRNIVELAIKRKTFPTGTTKKAEELAEESDYSFIQGLGEALSYMAGEMRFNMVPDIGSAETLMVDMPSPHEGPTFLKSIRKRWIEHEWRDSTDYEFFTEVWTEFVNNVVAPQDWLEKWENSRRHAVRTGKVEPQAGDEVWLQEEIDALAAPVEALMKLKNKATGS